MTDAAGDDEQPPRGLPDAVVGEASRADLVPWAATSCARRPADREYRSAGSRPEVESGAVERGKGGGITSLFVDAGESREPGDRRR